MADNEKDKTVPETDQHTDQLLDKNETSGIKNIMVTAGTGDANKSKKRRFDDITEKLQHIEESVTKILKTTEEEKNMRGTSIMSNKLLGNMADSEKGETVPEKYQKTNPLDRNDTPGTLEIMIPAGTEDINKSNKRRFDEITGQLRVIEESVAKILKTNEEEKKSKETSRMLNNQNRNGWNSEKRFVLKQVIQNLESFEMGKRYYIETAVHFNLKWRMAIKRNEKHLDFAIVCNPIAPVGDEFAVHTESKFSMMGNGNIITRTLKSCFVKSQRIGFKKCMDWDKIRHYAVDNKLTVEIEVEILKIIGYGRKKLRMFDESQKEFSDVILVVQDTKFYVLKKFLALQSTYFNSLFFGKYAESGKTEVRLNEIEAEDFHNFLELIHGESSIDDETVTGILQLADMYGSPTGIRRCEEFLLKDSKKSIVLKLQLALRCNLENLKIQFLSEVTGIADIEEIMAANIPEMDLSTSQALLQKSIAFSNK
ncbi:hypothetical protein B9Z55_026241 [Caenorhabditis nigoni]|uniref:BTB domain-containing protein n=1 Tax=Caenorhabditis nigoni TaxID=1611254 RepID=A0A2G5T1W9_9PELO|nr:hypothetical protein B9Z55_026241 [Caenorhabditis nigoni]